MPIQCDIYKSAVCAQTYLYIKKGASLDDIPDGLRQMLGELTQFLSLELTVNSQLAQVTAKDVIRDIDKQGYFLQMPPADLLNTQIPSSGYIQ